MKEIPQKIPPCAKMFVFPKQRAHKILGFPACDELGNENHFQVTEIPVPNLGKN